MFKFCSLAEKRSNKPLRRIYLTHLKNRFILRYIRVHNKYCYAHFNPAGVVYYVPPFHA